MVRKHLSKISVFPQNDIKKVLDILAINKSAQTALPAGIVLVTDQNRRLLGIATDGDIRRALARGVTLRDPISKAMNPNPFLIAGPRSEEEIVVLASHKIKSEGWHKDRLNKIIIVDKRRRVMDLVSFHDLQQKSDVRFKQIGVVGLGYVGLTLGLTLADLGFKVKGLDADPAVAGSLKSGRPHFFESGLEAILKNNLGKNFEVVENFKGANSCEVYFIAVGTPLLKSKKPDTSYLKSAGLTAGRALKSGDAVILRSTVPVGTTRNIVVPILERASGLKVGADFFAAFAPERTVEGKALEELRTLPQVIGGVNWASANLAANIFNHLTHSVVLVDSLEEAEMVKLVNNTYRDVVFSFANEISLICNKLGISSRRVIEAANRGYNRSQVPMPGPGVGGVCLEKDPYILVESAKAKGYSPLLARDSRRISEAMIDYVAGQVLGFVKNKKNSKVLILGFAFKGRPVTSDIRGSMAVKLAAQLKNKVKAVYGYDPAVSPNDIKNSGAISVLKINQGFKGADVIVVMNNNPEFEKLNMERLLKLSRKPVFVFDAWGIFEQNDLGKLDGVVYKHL